MTVLILRKNYLRIKSNFMVLLQGFNLFLRKYHRLNTLGPKHSQIPFLSNIKQVIFYFDIYFSILNIKIHSMNLTTSISKKKITISGKKTKKYITNSSWLFTFEYILDKKLQILFLQSIKKAYTKGYHFNFYNRNHMDLSMRYSFTCKTPIFIIINKLFLYNYIW